MRINSLYLVFVFFLIFVSIIPQQVRGDGFTQENLPPAIVGGRNVSLFVKINPAIITSESNQDRYILFRWFDANTNQTIQHTSFWVGISKNNQLLAQGIFHTHTGILTLKVTPSDDPKSWIIHGLKQQFLDGYVYSPLSNNGTIDLVAPILGEGGLYHVYVVLMTMDNDQNFFMPQDAPRFDSFLSVGDVSNHTITYKNNSYKTQIISYYDKISDFNFDPYNLRLSWSIPFDWNTTRFQNMPLLVHEELRIPKTFKAILNSTTFAATVNNEVINEGRVLVDPYSFQDNIVVHIILNKNDIVDFAKHLSLQTNTMNFTITPSIESVQTSTSILSDVGNLGVNLKWSPNYLSANTKNDLRLTFVDLFTQQQIMGDVNYTLRLLDSTGHIIVSKTNLTAKNGTDNQSLVLPSNGVYNIEMKIKSISSDTQVNINRTGLARGFIVIPSTTTNTVAVPEFGSSQDMVIIMGIVCMMIICRPFYKMDQK